MAVSSYLPEVAGGVVVAAAFADEAAASAALELLGSSGVRWQDTSVIAREAAVAERLAARRAWTPYRNATGLRRLLPVSPLPAELRRRFGPSLSEGGIVVAVAADGQPPDTVAALFTQAGATRVEQWWQEPASLFAPPELAGPF